EQSRARIVRALAMATTEAASGAPVEVPRGDAFRPPRLLAGAHVQTVLASSPLRQLALRRERARLARGAAEHVLDCGRGVRLQGFLNSAPRPARGTAVLLHGWEGSAASSYVVETASRLLESGFDVFRLNFRDHGDTHHLNPELFHSCRLDEVVGAVRAVRARFAQAPLALAGFSLGGNFALRVSLQAPDAVAHAIA